MELENVVALVLVGALVLVPLTRECVEFRRSWGLTWSGAVLTTLFILPALAVGLAVALSLADSFAVQWTVTVFVTLAVYSLATAAVRAALRPAQMPRRSG